MCDLDQFSKSQSHMANAIKLSANTDNCSMIESYLNLLSCILIDDNWRPSKQMLISNFVLHRQPL